jgi:hypothetical protein
MNIFKSGLQAGATLAVLLTAVGAAHSEPTQYVCTVEHAAGLHFDPQTSTWVTREFGTRKYMLRRLTDHDKKRRWWSSALRDPQANWAFFDFGKDDQTPLKTCSDHARWIVCKHPGLMKEASFDKKSRRFEVIYSGGYMDQGHYQPNREHPEEWPIEQHKYPMESSRQPDDLSVEIGNCIPS